MTADNDIKPDVFELFGSIGEENNVLFERIGGIAKVLDVAGGLRVEGLCDLGQCPQGFGEAFRSGGEAIPEIAAAHLVLDGLANAHVGQGVPACDETAGVEAGAVVGTASTLPLVFEGDKLVLNIKAAGSTKITITDKDGKEMAGFGLADCDEIKCDSTEKIVSWNGKSSVGALAGKTVRVKFEMRDAKL